MYFSSTYFFVFVFALVAMIEMKWEFGIATTLVEMPTKAWYVSYSHDFVS
jgi:hypothetical protein